MKLGVEVNGILFVGPRGFEAPILFQKIDPCPIEEVLVVPSPSPGVDEVGLKSPMLFVDVKLVEAEGVF